MDKIQLIKEQTYRLCLHICIMYDGLLSWNTSLIYSHYFQGEKLLGNLGGIFSKTWKPKKNRDITGPLTVTGQMFSNAICMLQDH